MTDLLIRNIEPHLKKMRIEANARKHEHSLSDEEKDLLRRALAVFDDEREARHAHLIDR